MRRGLYVCAETGGLLKLPEGHVVSPRASAIS